MPKIDLRAIRERVNLQLRRRQKENPAVREITQADLAQMLTAYGINISQTQLSRYEDNSENAPIALLMAWLRCLGTTLDQELMDLTRPTPPPIDPGRPYQRLRKRLDLLTDYLEHSGSTLQDRLPPEDAEALNNLAALATHLRKKPNLLLAGTFDAGKSTLANWLLGPDGQLPESYAPTTRLVTYIHHIEDRPKWADNTVYLLRSGWNHRYFDDEAHTTRFAAAKGDWVSLANHLSHESADHACDAKYALVFVDSPILHACNIVDPPGYGNDGIPNTTTEENDSQLADIASLSMDALAFLHVPQGFLETRDIELLRFHLKRLSLQCPPSLLNLQGVLLVITHAYPSVSDSSLEKIATSATRRIYRLLEPQLEELSQATGCALTEASVRSRISTFCKELPSRQETLKEHLRKLLSESLPAAWEARADSQVAQARQAGSEQMRRRMDMLSSVQRGRQEAEQIHQTLVADAPRHLAHLQSEEAAVVQQIHAFRDQHLAQFKTLYTSQISEAAIQRVIASRFTDPTTAKREAQSELPTYLIGLLEAELISMAREPTELLKKRIEVLLNGLETRLKLPSHLGAEILVPFDAKAAFLGGAVSVSAMGALALWASASNLGGYAVAAQVLGWVGLGGSAWMGAISAIGGPITLAIGIAAAIFFGIMALFRESWQVLLSRKVIEEFKKRDLHNKLLDSINAYWANTEDSFRAGISAYRDKYKSNMERVRAMAEDQVEWDADKVTSQIRLFDDAQGFFANLPWTPLGPTSAK
jgi:hypothetical protein